MSNIQTGAERIPFFFQAEDGIRDPLVTGVQTCALPISAPEILHPLSRSWPPGGGARESGSGTGTACVSPARHYSALWRAVYTAARSVTTPNSTVRPRAGARVGTAPAAAGCARYRLRRSAAMP